MENSGIIVGTGSRQHGTLKSQYPSAYEAMEATGIQPIGVYIQRRQTTKEERLVYRLWMYTPIGWIPVSSIASYADGYFDLNVQCCLEPVPTSPQLFAIFYWRENCTNVT